MAVEKYYNSIAGDLYLRYQLGRPHVDHLFKTEEFDGSVDKFFCAFCGYNSTLDGFKEILAKVNEYSLPVDEMFFSDVRRFLDKFLSDKEAVIFSSKCNRDSFRLVFKGIIIHEESIQRQKAQKIIEAGRLNALPVFVNGILERPSPVWAIDSEGVVHRPLGFMPISDRTIYRIQKQVVKAHDKNQKVLQKLYDDSMFE